MQKRGVILVIFLLFLIPFISAGSIDSEIQKVTHYAEEYETNNINYAQLLVYLSAARQNLNELVGVFDHDEGGVVKQDQLRSLLGEPQEETKWVWVEGENRDMRVDNYVPIWRKIVFDGNKIQIKLSAYPSMYREKSPELKEKIWALEDEGRYDEAHELRKTGGNEVLVYRLNFEKTFKQKEDFDLNAGIAEVKSLAEIFNLDDSKSNAEALAEESVNVERAFEEHFRQSPGKCEDIMISIFGAENLRETAGVLSYQITLHEEENLEAMLNLEMCEECEWNWINMHMWIDGRGRVKIPEPKGDDWGAQKRFKDLEWSEYETKTAELVEKIKSSLSEGNYGQAMSASNELNMLTQAWNEKSNNVWDQAEDFMEDFESSMSDSERQEYFDNYGWIKREQEKQGRLNDLKEDNFEKRKEFYLRLFDDYEKRESYVKQTQYEMRLIEEFRTVGSEQCDNNIDDNNDGAIDCADSVCGGQFCGSVIGMMIVDNETVEQKIDLFCIESKCQQKDEDFVEKGAVCGNNICENGEELSCIEDCVSCPVWDAVSCEGKLIFSGKDSTGCELAPICVEEDLSCEIDEDCADPLCGEASCVENTCQVVELEECSEAECVDGDEQRSQCNGDELVVGICIEGLWTDTGVECVGAPLGVPLSTEFEGKEEIINVECSTKEDCGGVNDVCSNGQCVTLPPAAEEEIVELPEFEGEKEPVGETEEKEAPPQEEPEEELVNLPEIAETGLVNLIFGAIGRITGLVTEGEEGTEGDTDTTDDQPTDGAQDNYDESFTEGDYPNSEPYSGDESFPEDGIYDQDYKPEENKDWELEENERRDNEGEERERRERKDNERQEEERDRKENDCKDRCERECNDRLIRPCAEDCIWEECGDDLLDCDIDSVTDKCERSCKEGEDIGSCVNDCNDKCLKDEETWDYNDDQRTWEEEVGVFNLGGGCRQEQGRTDAHLWFGGWGDPFDKIQPLKDKYYQGGHSDWCEREIEDAKIQRKEFEKSFNQEFAVWFFEKHLANSAEDWEQASSGIFELYYDGSMRISEELARSMSCLELDTIPFDYELVNFSYETEYGMIEYWEEVEVVDFKEFGERGEVEVISPYMKVWIFPSEEFIKYELKQSMIDHEFPGSPEDKVDRKKEGGLGEDEKARIKQDGTFMEKLGDIVSKYNGNMKATVEFKDYDTEEIVFNLYTQVNEEDIMTMEPMLPSEVPEKDVTITLDFDELYDLIYTSEKEMMGERVEYPHWSKDRPGPGKFREFRDGLKMANKVRKMVNNAEISPEAAEKDVKKLLKLFFQTMMRNGGGDEKGDREGEDKGEGPEGEEGFKTISGEVVRGF
ncbi:hypothetical protein HOD29_03870 [archaeon]|jgi:hypothetical protein|nr:hypothetical protein [archaeon]